MLVASGSLPYYKDVAPGVTLLGIAIFAMAGILGLTTVVAGLACRNWLAAAAGVPGLLCAGSIIVFPMLA
jgi:hypothetical protein